jgi:hypothetical protein
LLSSQSILCALQNSAAGATPARLAGYPSLMGFRCNQLASRTASTFFFALRTAACDNGRAFHRNPVLNPNAAPRNAADIAEPASGCCWFRIRVPATPAQLPITAHPKEYIVNLAINALLVSPVRALS